MRNVWWLLRRANSGSRMRTVPISTESCSAGFREFNNDTNDCNIFVNTIERPEEIDVRRADEAKLRAEEELRQKQSIIEYYQSKADLARAMARLKGASRHGRK